MSKKHCHKKKKQVKNSKSSEIPVGMIFAIWNSSMIIVIIVLKGLLGLLSFVK